MLRDGGPADGGHGEFWFPEPGAETGRGAARTSGVRQQSRGCTWGMSSGMYYYYILLKFYCRRRPRGRAGKAIPTDSGMQKQVHE